MPPEVIQVDDFWVIEDYLGTGYLENIFISPEVSPGPQSDYFSLTKSFDMATHFPDEISAQTFVEEWKRQLTGLGRLTYPVRINVVAIKRQSFDAKANISIELL